MRRKKRTWEEQRRIDQQRDYDDLHTVQIKLKFNKNTDSDIIEWVESVKQRWNRKTTLQGELKRLIRQEIANTEVSRIL